MPDTEPADQSRRQLALDAGRVGVFDWDLTTGRLAWDERLIELFDYDPSDFDESIEAFNARVHPDDLPRVTRDLRHAIDTLGEFDAEYRLLLPSGATRWIGAHGRALAGPDGEAVRVLGAAYDITDRRLLRSEAERTARRAALLDQLTRDLVATLSHEQAADRLARLVVPTVADWCVVTLIDDDEHAGTRRGLRGVAGRHRDPALQDVVDEYAHIRLGEMSDDSIVVAAVETGKEQHIHTDATAAVQAILYPGRARELMGRLEPEAVVVVPLPGSSGPVGMLSLANVAPRGDFSAEDMVTVRHVAARAGLVLENARLYRQQRDLAEELQRAMLTAPVEPDHVEIAVRYLPAGEGAQAGGDWYDAFIQPSGDSVVTVGDVCGHDSIAAAVMGQLRSILRGIAVSSGAGPAEILDSVDRAMRTLQITTTATAMVGRLEQTPDELTAGVTRFRFATAGHLPALVADPSGEARLLDDGPPQLMLGVHADVRRAEHQVEFARGSTLLMYTDGLVERRGEPYDEGVARLLGVFGELVRSGLDLDELCDAVLERMLPERPADDVVLLGVRLHPQDRPRPAAAGPERVPRGLPPYRAPEPSG